MSLPKTYKTIYGASKPGEKHTFATVPIPELTKNQVLIKMEFAPLNPSDIQVLHGESKYGPFDPHPVGLEGSGTVAAVGPELKVIHKVGDRVHVHGQGTYGEYVVAESEYVSPIQGDLSFEQAASHFINPGTVYCFKELAEKNNAKAVIHTAGSSALGRILIKYFKHLGIKVINVVRNDSYIEELKAEGADYVLNSQAPDFEAKLKEVAYKEKATVAFEAVNGDFPNIIIKNMPPHSTLYIYGSLAGTHISHFHYRYLTNDRKISAFVIFDYLAELEENGGLKEYFEEVHKLLPTYFATKIEKVFKVDQIEEAVEYHKKYASKGKILITPN